MPQPDSPQEAALEHLRIIRTLMERAHIYRAVSAPAALCGGVMALGLAAYGFHDSQSKPDHVPRLTFVLSWIVILVIASILNFILLMRESQGRGQPVFTDGLRMALRAFYPPMLAGGVLGIGLILKDDALMPLAAIIWILCYGLALLGTGSFSPKSINRLGFAFLYSGLILAVWWFSGAGTPFVQGPPALAALFLGLTFGMFHLAYAAGVFLSKPDTIAR